MMRVDKSNSAMTLTELLVATILVGIVMVGALSVDFATRSSRSSSVQNARLVSKVEEAMLWMSRDALKAIGHETNGAWQTRGIYTYSGGTWRTICFREDFMGTPGDYGDDKWNCYEHGPSDSIEHCERTEADLTPEVEVDCWNDPDNVSLIKLAGVSTPPSSFFRVAVNGAGRLLYVEITLSANYQCSFEWQCAVAVHPLKNPEFVLTSRFNPIGISR